MPPALNGRGFPDCQSIYGGNSVLALSALQIRTPKGTIYATGKRVPVSAAIFVHSLPAGSRFDCSLP
jgi:hypothetical protein